MKRFLLPFILAISVAAVSGQTPDWSTSIASIIYANCTECHHEGGIGPMSLMTYDDAVTNSFSIQAQVNAKLMPPWPADPNYNHFWDEKVLTEDEITRINDWVNGGMPLGDPGQAPAPPVYVNGVTMVNPDDTIILPTFEVPTDEDVYWTFVIPSGYNETKYVNQVEFVPGNPAVVHHVIYNQDTSDETLLLDDAYPGPGYPTYTFDNPSNTSINWGGWTPGKGILKWPENMAFEIHAHSYFIISMHFSPGSAGQMDSSRIYLKYSTLPDSLVRRVQQQRFLINTPPSLMNPPFYVFANTIDTFYEKSEIFSSNKSLLGLSPHSHFVCKSWEVFMVDDANDTTRLIYIPNWDFNWQYNYLLTKVIMIPKYSQLFGIATFDNTVNNPDNPHNPPEDIHIGGSSEQEMMNCRFWLMDYMYGDENIILDSAFYGYPTGTASVPDKGLDLEVYPNPAGETVHFSVYLPEPDVSYVLQDLTGSVITSTHRKKVPKGVFVADVSVKNLPAGMYLLQVFSGEKYGFRKISVAR